jgi:hypothetical protein
MGVVIEICIKYPGGPTRMTVTDVQWPFSNGLKCPFGCNGYVTAVAVLVLTKPAPLFWCRNL